MTEAPNPGGWPDRDRPGVPENPERDGWHWVGYFAGQVPRARFWYAEDNGWGFGPPATEPEKCLYYGPILYPAEVAAIRAEAFKAGAEAGIKAAADYCHGRTTSRSFGSWADAFEAAEHGIRALRLPTPSEPPA